MTSFPSTSLVRIKDKLEKLFKSNGSDNASMTDLEMEIRKSDLDLLDKVNKIIQELNVGLIQGSKDVEYIPIFQGFGTVTGINFFWSRVGNHIKTIGRFVTGTPTAAEMRISLPINTATGSAFISDSKLISAIVGCGNVYPGNLTTAGAVYCLIEPGVGYITVGVENAGAAALVKLAGSAVFGSSNTVAVQFDLPIDGWN